MKHVSDEKAHGSRVHFTKRMSSAQYQAWCQKMARSQRSAWKVRKAHSDPQDHRRTVKNGNGTSAATVRIPMPQADEMDVNAIEAGTNFPVELANTLTAINGEIGQLEAQRKTVLEAMRLAVKYQGTGHA